MHVFLLPLARYFSNYKANESRQFDYVKSQGLHLYFFIKQQPAMIRTIPSINSQNHGGVMQMIIIVPPAINIAGKILL